MERQPSHPTQTNAAKPLRPLRWIASLAAGIALLLVISGISYQAVKAREDARRFHEEGKLVDVGGYKLNIDCTGKGSPTVVLESGVEVPAEGWHLVQPGIASFTRVCSYDRAGYGWSDPGPMPRKLSQIVLELHTLLQNAGEKPPYILVGHSFGKGSVLLYNKLYPNEVAGMVLAEGGPDKLKLPASIKALSEADLRRRQRSRRFASALYFFGISRYLARKDIEGAGEPTYDQEWSYEAIQPKFIRAATSEVENLLSGDSQAELADVPTLGDKPLRVLIAGKGMWGLPLTSQDWVDLRKNWVNGQIQLAQHLSTRGKWLVVSDSTHAIPDERPDTIVGAVRDVYADTKQRDGAIPNSR
jgi:pimeloyl-ACP methyl ester carboxylesterase